MKQLTVILMLWCTIGVAGAAVIANNSDDLYFNPAASMYVQGDSVSASNLVVKGLSAYPDNGRLKRLLELIKKQQQQEQQQNEQEQQNQKDQQKDQEKQKPEQQENQQPEDGDEQQPQEQQPQPMTAAQMTEDEAKQLLDAMKQEEQNKRAQLHPVLGSPVKVDKDW